MTTEPTDTTATSPVPKCLKHVFYQRLAWLLEEGGFDRHMSALCKPFIANTTGPAWWSERPSSYFRLLFVGFLEGIESEQELCWKVEDSLSFRDFAGFGRTTEFPDPPTLARLRQPLLPLIHSEAFDALLRIVDKSGLVEGRVSDLDTRSIAADPEVSPIVQRLRSKDHQNYWKRLIKAPGASRSMRSLFPARSSEARSSEAIPQGTLAQGPELFALWLEDLSSVHAMLSELKNQGVTDFKAYFAEHDSPILDHIVRACVYGRGPNSVRAFLCTHADEPDRELPQQMATESINGCKSIAVALAEGRKQFSLELPLLDAKGEPALALVQLAVLPGHEDALSHVAVAFTDITARAARMSGNGNTKTPFEQALELNRVGVWQWDVANDVTLWSDAMLRIYGIAREDFTGKHSDYLECTYPEDRESQREAVRQSFNDGAPHHSTQRPPADVSTLFRDYRIRRKDGMIRWVRGAAVESVDDQGRPNKVEGVLWDITESKYAELAVRESEERYRHIVELSALPIVASAFDGETLFANESALAFFGIDRDGLLQLRADDYWEDQAQRSEAAAQLAANGELRGFEARFRIGPDREPRVVLITASVIEYGNRNVIISFLQDITGLKCLETQQQLTQQETEAQLRAVQALADEQLIATRAQCEEQLRIIQSQADERVRAAKLQGEEALLAAQQKAEEALSTCVRELALMKRVMVDGQQDPTKILDVACRELVQAFDLPLAFGGLLSDDGRAFGVMTEHVGSGHPSHLGARVAPLIGLFSPDPRPLWIDDASNDERAAVFRVLLGSDPSTPCLVLPLVADGLLLGLLLLGPGTGRTLGEYARNLAWNVSGQVARTLAIAHERAVCQRLTRALGQIREIVTDVNLAPPNG